MVEVDCRLRLIVSLLLTLDLSLGLRVHATHSLSMCHCVSFLSRPFVPLSSACFLIAQ